MLSYKEIIENEKKKEYYKKLEGIVKCEYENYIVYPPRNVIFKAFELCTFENTKVVILGQDPYHNEDQAMGLSFSTPKHIKNPPSMQNILKEIQNDTKQKSICENGDLTPWAKQGVLLLNSILSVRKNEASSHKNTGWEIFSDNIIKTISDKKENVVFILWGSYAKNKAKFIDEKKHLILTSAHPSPLSAYRGFFNSKVFSKTNKFLESKKLVGVKW